LDQWSNDNGNLSSGKCPLPAVPKEGESEGSDKVYRRKCRRHVKWAVPSSLRRCGSFSVRRTSVFANRIEVEKIDPLPSTISHSVLSDLCKRSVIEVSLKASGKRDTFGELREYRAMHFVGPI
jgi:hypothetical protein